LRPGFRNPIFSLVPLPWALYAAILGIAGGYVLAAEGVKR